MAGDLTDLGLTNSIVLKNIEALYYKPKTQRQFVNDEENLNSLSYNDLMSRVPKDWFKNKNGSYYVDEPITVWGKDGQTNAYVKRGLDVEVEEYFDVQETNKYIWYFLTDDKVEILSGGKFVAKGREWFVLKVISQETIGSEQNRYNAMYIPANSKRSNIFGQKLVVLI